MSWETTNLSIYLIYLVCLGGADMTGKLFFLHPLHWPELPRINPCQTFHDFLEMEVGVRILKIYFVDQTTLKMFATFFYFH